MVMGSSANGTPRAAVLKGGSIFFDGRLTPCIVRELSDSGARLLVYAPDLLPTNFRLYVEISRTEFDCKLVQRCGKEIEVVFVGHPTVVDAPEFHPRAAQAEAALRGHLQAGSKPRLVPKLSKVSRVPILIAEDDPDDRMLITDAFNASDTLYDLNFAANGQEVLDYLAGIDPSRERQTPALILLDLNMPKMDGRTVLRQIKQDPRFKRIPVVVFTTSNSDDDVESTYDLGISSYIVKPSDHDGLLGVVRLLNDYWGQHVRRAK